MGNSVVNLLERSLGHSLVLIMRRSLCFSLMATSYCSVLTPAIIESTLEVLREQCGEPCLASFQKLLPEIEAFTEGTQTHSHSLFQANDALTSVMKRLTHEALVNAEDVRRNAKVLENSVSSFASQTSSDAQSRVSG